MRLTRLAAPLALWLACLAFVACSAAPAPAAPPAQAAPAPPAASAPDQPEPGPTHPAGATPRLGARPKPVQVDIRGRITQVHRSFYGEAPVGTIVVEGALEPDTRFDRASIHVSRETKVVRTRGGERIPFNQLKVGNLVEATFAGPVAESYPVQATAAEIVILASEPVEK